MEPERKVSFTESLLSMASPIVEKTESFRSLLLERTDSIRSMASPIVERAISVRNLLFVQVKKRKSVTFGEIHNRVHRILSRNGYSNEELDAAFYCRGDYDCMKKKRRSAENLLERSAQDVTEAAAAAAADDDDDEDDDNDDDEDEDNTDCENGLETKAEADERRNMTTKSVVAVLLEQEMQWNDDQTILDPDLLADIYFEFSAASHQGAHERALKLEASIRCYIAPCRWSPAFKKTSRRSISGGKPEPRRPTLERRISAPEGPSAAPFQPVRESSFRWMTLKKQPVREPLIMGKPEHRRPKQILPLITPLPSSAAPTQPPVRESSFRRRAPKQPIRELSQRVLTFLGPL
jgi:hypothetical protein